MLGTWCCYRWQPLLQASFQVQITRQKTRRQAQNGVHHLLLGPETPERFQGGQQKGFRGYLQTTSHPQPTVCHCLLSKLGLCSLFPDRQLQQAEVFGVRLFLPRILVLPQIPVSVSLVL